MVDRSKVYLARIKVDGEWTGLGLLKEIIMPLPGGEAYSFRNSAHDTLVFNLDNAHIIKEL